MQPLFCQPTGGSSLFSAEGFVGLIFLATVGLVLSGALIATTSRHLVRCVAGLAVSFTGVAGIYYFLLSPFVAMMQMLIYVGAVSILIAFAVMMAAPEDQTGKYQVSTLATPVGISLGAVFSVALAFMGLKTEWQAFPRQQGGGIEEVGKAFLTSYSMVFELISIVLLIAIIGALVLARRGRS